MATWTGGRAESLKRGSARPPLGLLGLAASAPGAQLGAGGVEVPPALTSGSDLLRGDHAIGLPPGHSAPAHAQRQG